MFVALLDEIENLTDLVAELQAPAGQLSQQNHVVRGTTRKGKSVQKTSDIGAKSKNLSRKDAFQKKAYTEEAVDKDSRLNIYTGNPGYYTTAGDTVYFGTVTTLSDSAFLQSLRPVVPHTIKPYGMVGKERIVPGQDWVLGFILILWMIFASVRVEFPEYLGQIFSGLVNFNAASRLFRQRGYKTMFGAVRLDLIFYFTLPLSVFQIAQFFKVDIPGFPSIILFIAILLIINVYFFIKILIHRLVGSIAMLKDQTDELVFNIRLYYRALGFVLLPIATVHAILPETNFITIWGMAILIFIMYIAALFRSIYLGYQKDISIFYLILYLCTLEILPLLLIFKLVMKQ
jgi:hypothetical protein